MNVSFNPAISMGSRASMQKKVVEEVSGPFVSRLQEQIAALGKTKNIEPFEIDGIYSKALKLAEEGGPAESYIKIAKQLGSRGGDEFLGYMTKIGQDAEKYALEIGTRLKSMFQ